MHYKNEAAKYGRYWGGKKEFNLFGGMLHKAQKNIQTGLSQLDDVVGKRTKAIQRRLRGVEDLQDSTTPV